MTRPSRLLLPAACLAVLALPACSSDSGGGDDAAAVKAAYVQKASAVCDRVTQERAALARPTGAADFAPFVRSSVTIAEKAEADLRALTPPEADRADLESKVLGPLSADIEKGRVVATKAEAAGGDPTKLGGLLSEIPTGQAIDRAYLKSYGLDSCVKAVEFQ
jgi:hypothetical protein